MIYRIDKNLLDLGGGIYTGVVAAFGVNNAVVNEKIAAILQEEVAKAVDTLSGGSVKNEPMLAFYQKAMKSININPSKYPCSIEAILNRISKKGEFPSLCPAVDLGNYISIKYRVPVGVHDVDTLQGELVVRKANEDDCIIEENSLEKDPLTQGEPVYVTGNSVRTRRWMWRQMPAGRVDEGTSNFIFLIDGFNDNKETVDKACTEMMRAARRF